MAAIRSSDWPGAAAGCLNAAMHKGGPMFDTRNDLPAGTRTKIIELLNARLADAIDLGAQTKHAHWNVKGPNFIALHELFDKIYSEVSEDVDMIAERIMQLGGSAHGDRK